MNTKEMIGSRLKVIRNNKGMTQEQLSEMVGINSKYLSSIERGKENPTLNMIIKISESLDATIDDIFKDIEIEDPKNRLRLINETLNRANDEQLKLVFHIVSAIIK